MAGCNHMLPCKFIQYMIPLCGWWSVSDPSCHCNHCYRVVCLLWGTGWDWRNSWVLSMW